MEKLSMEQIHSKIKAVPGWQLDGEAIKREWKFRDFSEAMKFINEVAALADKYDHHPELFNVYNTVSIRYSTHDAGGLTNRDFKLADEINHIDMS
jgi:4a-hydroxytetrahydrobiopterin dehydratase